jgi:CheY-like chemotaxis protein
MPDVMGAGGDTPVAGNGDRDGVAKQTILLVEDEDIVRGLLREVLERDGYEVLACAHPDEGIEASRLHGKQIDLLLTDVVMPGMNGRQMANRILETLPELRVVFMSGYSEHALTHEGQVDSQFEYLQKPFTLKALSKKLTHVLGTRAQ